MDELVLDVSRYKFEHPGGKFLLEHCIGTDISKFFYGGYSLEPKSVSPHRHSNLSRSIINSLVVARLNDSAITFRARIATKSIHNSFT